MAELDQRVIRNPESAYERSDWPMAAIGITVLLVLALLAVAPLVLRAAYSTADTGHRLLAPPPNPRLQTDPSDDLARLRAEEQTRLTTYGWVDRQKGIVRIPIEEAMKKLVAQGIDGFPRGKP
jgi:hypothetical protein